MPPGPAPEGAVSELLRTWLGAWKAQGPLLQTMGSLVGTATGDTRRHPFPHLRSQDLQAGYTEDLTSPTGSRTPAGPLERPPGESRQGQRRAVKVHREAPGTVRAGGSGAQGAAEAQGAVEVRVSVGSTAQGRARPRAVGAASPVQGGARPGQEGRMGSLFKPCDLDPAPPGP